MIELILKLFSALGTWGSIGAVLVTLLGGYAAYKGWEYHLANIYDARGYARAIHEIAVENQEALGRVKVQKDKLRACIDGGGTWDQSDGVCR